MKQLLEVPFPLSSLLNHFEERQQIWLGFQLPLWYWTALFLLLHSPPLCPSSRKQWDLSGVLSVEVLGCPLLECPWIIMFYPYVSSSPDVTGAASCSFVFSNPCWHCHPLPCVSGSLFVPFSSLSATSLVEHACVVWLGKSLVGDTEWAWGIVCYLYILRWFLLMLELTDTLSRVWVSQ